MNALAAVPNTVAILGAGAWGTALANQAARTGRRTLLWARDPVHAAVMRIERSNNRRLPGIALEPSVEPTDNFAAAAACAVVLAAAPAQYMRALAQTARPHAVEGANWISCAKGLERGSRAFMSDVLRQELPHVQISILSGPSFAEDVARGLPTAVTLAAKDEILAQQLCKYLGSSRFRLYHTVDMRGVEIGGAAKNVLAIACGVAAGRGLGASAHAALIARGFAELTRLGLRMGARAETLMGLSGLGDVVLTCGSMQSRNYAFGFALGKGKSLAEAGGCKLAEGAFTAQALLELAEMEKVEMPICASVAQILQGTLSVQAVINALLLRPFRQEI